MTISKQYIADEQTDVVSISKPHINTIQNDCMRQYRNNIVPILACLLGCFMCFCFSCYYGPLLSLTQIINKIKIGKKPSRDWLEKVSVSVSVYLFIITKIT